MLVKCQCAYDVLQCNSSTLMYDVSLIWQQSQDAYNFSIKAVKN